MQPNTLYDLGILDSNDNLDITYNILVDADGSEVYVIRFTAGATDHNIVFNFSDDTTVNTDNIRVLAEFKIGAIYEIIMSGYVIIVG